METYHTWTVSVKNLVVPEPASWRLSGWLIRFDTPRHHGTIVSPFTDFGTVIELSQWKPLPLFFTDSLPREGYESFEDRLVRSECVKLETKDRGIWAEAILDNTYGDCPEDADESIQELWKEYRLDRERRFRHWRRLARQNLLSWNPGLIDIEYFDDKAMYISKCKIVAAVILESPYGASSSAVRMTRYC